MERSLLWRVTHPDAGWGLILRTWVLYLAAIGGLLVAAQLGEWRIAALAAAVLVVVSWRVRRELGELRNANRRRYALTSAGVVAAGVLLAVFWFIGDSAGWIGFVGLIGVYFGLGQLLATLRGSDKGGPWRGVQVIAACAAVGGFGLLVLTLEAAGWALFPMLAGMLLAPSGLSLLSEDVLRGRIATVRFPWLTSLDPRDGRFSLAVALGLLEAGVITLLAMGAPLRYVLVGVLGVFVLVGLITSHTDSDAIVVLVAIALVWSLSPRDASLDDHPVVAHAPGTSTLVALGDSFISGEGAETYFAGTNTRKTNECRRAPTAYPVLVTERDDPDDVIPDQVLFLACSGAKAEHLDAVPQYKGEPVDLPPESGGLTQLTQLAAFAGDLDVRLVIVSIGGNDALFGEIGRACVGPGDCSELGQFWLDHLGGLQPTLVATYETIKSTLAELGHADVPVLVMPYPIPLDDDGCSWSLLSAREHRFLYRFTDELDDVMQRAAAEAGVHFLDEMRTSLEDRDLRICDRDPADVGVNFLAANPVAGVLQQQVSPVNWFHNSLHPNATGHAAIADVLAAWIGEHLGPGDELPELTGPISGDVAHITEIMGRRFKHCAELGSGLASCRSGTDVWTTAHAARLVWYGSGAVILLALGAWVFWLQVISRRRASPPTRARA